VPEVAAKQKDLVQRLESTLIHWTRQIKEVVNRQDDGDETEDVHAATHTATHHACRHHKRRRTPVVGGGRRRSAALRTTNGARIHRLMRCLSALALPRVVAPTGG
jgi:hypothetical protein